MGTDTHNIAERSLIKKSILVNEINPQNIVENSPIFYVPKIETPVLIMHNDNDGAVPWHQGIEYFVRYLSRKTFILI